MTDATSDDPDTYPAAGQPTSCLVLHSNRHATVVLDDGTQERLRPPTVGAWRKFTAVYAAAQARLDSLAKARAALAQKREAERNHNDSHGGVYADCPECN